ncbi:hypothetical protein TVAG_079520 [Trichomonas vaginalis G3]|uniref:Uncharacterized protein n=1 Tax=Trichomonas vaginalis (strain ATCC PRA-98 / G3) TaxID=412133 RepID=A2EF84_TRIV3|nr:nuclear chaperone required for maturation and nuclear export of pre-60s ribosome subunits [Trichomonas vaginalis G3]EAY08694.1 hypothetical protein TVAG_079520 [Trichomonas vaginalis G3]KAI5492821.1 nuclear chaperone required for maturation and nuclear export of pre-60s ribosome subunits [Trichomonas vaginalis G3]|eukprot:XP_001320917.1 hypothetical protein [Trichomonas vaginalis G3]
MIDTSSISVDFTDANESVFSIAAINFQGDTVIPSFSALKADVPGILRCIQTTPIRIPIYILGDVSKVKIEFTPKSENTPIPTYEVKESQIDLLFPINGIIKDISFTGTMNINSTIVTYQVDAHFIDSAILIDSPGNSFIPQNGFKFEKDLIAEDSISFIPTIPGVDHPKQKILIQNQVSRIKTSPFIPLDDNTIELRKLYANETKIYGAAFNLYHSAANDSYIRINTPDSIQNKNVLFNVLSPYTDFSDQIKEIQISTKPLKYKFLVCFLLRSNDNPNVYVISTDDVSINNLKIITQFDVPESSVEIEFEMNSIAADINEQSNIEIRITGKQFKWRNMFVLKVNETLESNNFENEILDKQNRENFQKLHETDGKYLPSLNTAMAKEYKLKDAKELSTVPLDYSHWNTHVSLFSLH